jgi:hypothetical protein
MKTRTIVLLMLLAMLTSFAIILGCNGQDGEDGNDGELLGAQPDDDDDNDDAVGDDDDDAVDDDDDDDATGFDKDDLDYAEDCPDLADCVVAGCQATPDVDSYEHLQCVLLSCKDDYESCFGTYGTGACVNVFKCLQACLPADCLEGCLAGSSYEALLEFADAAVCVEDNCPDALEDPLGNIGCFTGVCNQPVATCCGGTLLGCM